MEKLHLEKKQGARAFLFTKIWDPYKSLEPREILYATEYQSPVAERKPEFVRKDGDQAFKLSQN